MTQCVNLVQRLALQALWLTLGLAWQALGAQAAQSRDCGEAAWHFEPLAPGLWWLAGANAPANAQNRGQVTHVLIGVTPDRVWALGSGPSVAFGRRLNCQVRQRFGRAITDVISPWPHPETVLGQTALVQARHWAHTDVARAMATRCQACIERLRARLGEAASDLGTEPARLPTHQTQGSHGRLGPWHWWRINQAPGTTVTVWNWSGSMLMHAPGLIWGEGAPDGQDSNAEAMGQASRQLMGLVREPDRPGWRWLGGQGLALPWDAAERHAQYWSAVAQAAERAVERGDDVGAAPVLPGLEAMSHGLRHELNWQRTWRQAEDRAFQRKRR